MLKRIATPLAIATTTCAVLLGLPNIAQAADLRFADLEGDDAEGVFTPLVPRSPGIYGLEARGGRPGNRDWEIGVGIWTSQPNPGGPRNFNEANFDWSVPGLFDFEMSWLDDILSVTIGGKTVQYAADWLIGNTIKISAVGDAVFNLETIDDQSLPSSIAGIPGNGTLQTSYVTGNLVTDGWLMTGTIDIANGGGSRNEVLITMGNFEPDVAVPEPSSVLGLLTVGSAIAGGKLIQRRKLG
ncbi:MAG: PEP-CTERM sorting domain-containing protein [Thainema sp.]